MNVVYTFDDGYSIVTAVSMVSLLENNKDVQKLELYIVDCGISDKHKKNFKNLALKYDRNIYFINGKNMESLIPIKLDLGYWSFVCYVRLFFSQLFPDLDRVLHIDCDTIIKDNLEEIYNIDLGDALCAGCYDCIPTTKYMAKLPKDRAYYSNGFLLFDLCRMRSENIQQKFIEYIIDKKGKLPHLDQDVVNAVLSERILPLSPRYNVMTYIALFREKTKLFFYENDIFYDEKKLKEAVDNPAVIHFVGYRFVSKPWTQKCYHPYNKEWISFYDKINEIFDDDGRTIRKKKKKYGMFREIVCLIWNLGYRIPLINDCELKYEINKVRKRCEIFMDY